MEAVVQQATALDRLYAPVRCRSNRAAAMAYPLRREALLQARLKTSKGTSANALGRLDYLMKRESLLHTQYGQALVESGAVMHSPPSTMSASVSFPSASSSMIATASQLVAGAIPAFRGRASSNSSITSDASSVTVRSTSSGSRLANRGGARGDDSSSSSASVAASGEQVSAAEEQQLIAARLAASLRPGASIALGMPAGGPSALSSLTASSSAEPKRPPAPVGVSRYTTYQPYHVFSHHFASVMSVAFAHYDRDLIALGSNDGSVSVCRAWNDPGIVHILRHDLATTRLPSGTTAATFASPHAVTDVDWSATNEHVLSCSRDGTARVWDLVSGSCARILGAPSGPAITAGRFHPVNNNMIVLGNARAGVEFYNMSTGKPFKGSQVAVNGAVKCFEFNPNGSFLWAGDAQGNVTMFSVDMASGKLVRLCKTTVGTTPSQAVTSIRFRAGSSTIPTSSASSVASASTVTAATTAEQPSLLLVNCRGQNAVTLFAVSGGSKPGLQSIRTFPVPNPDLDLRSRWSPLLVAAAPGSADVFASGSEDHAVHLINAGASENEPKLIAKLQGHSAPILDVDFNYDESLLVSVDAKGIVRVWKRGRQQ
ncbi:WDR13 protein [Capsaspora owczarzaki ATCC 30864]|uniref:WDR13 protein n=1 Tax=Capsaspora owczarzaki (strain ATCC 30864) TaxID=595528 RepID=A0A0D2UBA3_CAPO3|nr:WDR13 protein [Capsaspora owczarzaki ATCC 30864]KJE92326.1 WDR13 protein [Capsaspora owczarzaki ATCC 30864]|eukprot:XP_004364153.2 WDR13 protein [Capsaspora owczarzaki ATCC 30864]